MSVFVRLSCVAFALATLCVPCAAQQVAPQPLRKGVPTIQSAPVKPGGQQVRTANKPIVGEQNVDAMIAGMLALANEEEAIIGKFAAERAKHEQVQKFASMMDKEHSKMAKELQKWAPQATLDRTESDGRDGQADQSAEAGFNPLKVHRQIASRCIASTEKELSSKKGADFDMCYIGGQCVMHQQMIDKATVLREYVTPDLQESIDKGISDAERHLKQAKKLIDELASAEKSTGR